MEVEGYKRNSSTLEPQNKDIDDEDGDRIKV
jgi:hypothetical protein